MAGLLFGKDEHTLKKSIDVLIKRKAKNLSFLEIGCHRGHTSLLLINYIKRYTSDFAYYGIDPGGLRPNKSYRLNGVIRDLRNTNFKLIKGFSFEVADQFNSLDWIFVDGCHCAECVRKDIELYLPKLSQDGLISFHDASADAQGKSNQDYDLLREYHDRNLARKKGIQVLDTLRDLDACLIIPPEIHQKLGGIAVYSKARRPCL